MGRLFGLAAPALRGAAQSYGAGTPADCCRTAAAERPLPAAEERRELLHDATEALLGGFDPITPIKPYLGEGYEKLVALHQAALDTRYALPAWDEQSYRAHKRADHLAAASEGLHVVGWSREELRDDLEITLEP